MGEASRDGAKASTFEARAEGSSIVPKSWVAFSRSTSLTFW